MEYPIPVLLILLALAAGVIGVIIDRRLSARGSVTPHAEHQEIHLFFHPDNGTIPCDVVTRMRLRLGKNCNRLRIPFFIHDPSSITPSSIMGARLLQQWHYGARIDRAGHHTKGHTSTAKMEEGIVTPQAIVSDSRALVLDFGTIEAAANHAPRQEENTTNDKPDGRNSNPGAGRDRRDIRHTTKPTIKYKPSIMEWLTGVRKFDFSQYLHHRFHPCRSDQSMRLHIPFPTRHIRVVAHFGAIHITDLRCLPSPDTQPVHPARHHGRTEQKEHGTFSYHGRNITAGSDLELRWTWPANIQWQERRERARKKAIRHFASLRMPPVENNPAIENDEPHPSSNPEEHPIIKAARQRERLIRASKSPPFPSEKKGRNARKIRDIGKNDTDRQ